MANISDIEIEKINLEKHKAELDLYKAEIDKWATGFNGTMTLATLGIKSLILVNGAAVISLLTFIGNRAKIVTPDCFIWAFGTYLAGIVLALICLLIAYIFQVVEIETEKKRIAFWLRIAAITFSVFSLLAFAGGSIFSMYGFAKLEPKTETSITTPKTTEKAPNHTPSTLPNKAVDKPGMTH